MSEVARPRVLCVDDEARIVEGLVLHLRKDYEVHTALGGDEALKTLKSIGGASVVVSDMRMPEMDGVETILAVRGRYPATKIIAVSGGGLSPAENFLEIARRLGSHKTLAKPLVAEEFLRAVHELIG